MDVASDTHKAEKGDLPLYGDRDEEITSQLNTEQGYHPSSLTSLKGNWCEGRKREEQEEQVLPLTRFPRVIHHCQMTANDDLYHRLPLGCLASQLGE